MVQKCVYNNEKEKRLKSVARKISRRIFEPKRVGENEYRPLKNHKIEEKLDGERRVKIIIVIRIRWYGHIHRIEYSSVIRGMTG